MCGNNSNSVRWNNQKSGDPLIIYHSWTRHFPFWMHVYSVKKTPNSSSHRVFIRRYSRCHSLVITVPFIKSSLQPGVPSQKLVTLSAMALLRNRNQVRLFRYHANESRWEDGRLIRDDITDLETSKWGQECEQDRWRMITLATLISHKIYKSSWQELLSFPYDDIILTFDSDPSLTFVVPDVICTMATERSARIA